MLAALTNPSWPIASIIPAGPMLRELSPLSLPEVWRTLTLQAGHNTSVVILASALLGLAAGLIGSFALLRKRTLVADALSHATLPGIAGAFLLVTAMGGAGKSLPVLLIGAALSAAIAAWLIQLITHHTRVREDAAIGIVLASGFGLGVVLLGIAQRQTQASAGGLHHFIYGQAAAMGERDAVLMGSIALAALAVTLTLKKELCLVCFNDAFARVTGWPVRGVDLMMMALVVTVVVAGLQAVGLIMVIALLVIPPAAARFWTESLGRMLMVSALFGALSGYLGASLSALLPDMPAGSVIVLSAGALFVLSMVLAPSRGVVASAVRRVDLRLKIAADHLLELIHDRGAPAGPQTMRDFARARGWSGARARLFARVLRWRGLLSRTPAGFAPTGAGRERGARVARNHALWETYLITHADVAPSHVDWSVDQVEHVLSDELIAELEHRLAMDGVSIPAATPNGGAT
ncbi:MAG: manganese/zinc/iron transport system permease protein [Phycisphaerales bacterium]|jgi:manganese/zinc/iron transport system permease protein